MKLFYDVYIYKKYGGHTNEKSVSFITDGFSDWEASYVTAELNKPGTGFQVQTIAIDKDPKISMGGLTVLPDYSLQDFSFNWNL